MPNKRIYYKDESFELRCEWNKCSQEFTDIDLYLGHISFHINNEYIEKLICLWEGCESAGNQIEYSTLSDLLRHALYHGFHAKVKCCGANILKRDPKLGQCTYGATYLNVIPEVSQSMMCQWQQCGEKFDSPELFYRHVNAHVMQYKDVKPLQCLWTSCNANRLSCLTKLRSHLHSHTQEKMVACPTCGCLYANRTKFVDHILRQSAIAQEFQCSICSKAYASDRLLREHMRNHALKYKCGHCDFLGVTPSSVDNHIKQRHSEKRTHKCPFCDYCGKTAFNLKRHQETHDPDRAFNCNENGCDYVCKNYSTLVKHYKKIHLQRPQKYACHLCVDTFSSGFLLTKHLQKKHDWKPNSSEKIQFKEYSEGVYRMAFTGYSVLNEEIENTPMDVANDDDKPNEIIVQIKNEDGSTYVCSLPAQYDSKPGEQATVSFVLPQMCQAQPSEISQQVQSLQPP